MARLAVTFVALFCLLPSASAGLSPKSDPSSLGTGFPPELVKAPPREAAPAASAFVITAQTEVKLDGCTCQYKDVPEGAGVLLLEVAADKKTILKIHFRTRK